MTGQPLSRERYDGYTYNKVHNIRYEYNRENRKLRCVLYENETERMKTGKGLD